MPGKPRKGLGALWIAIAVGLVATVGGLLVGSWHTRRQFNRKGEGPLPPVPEAGFGVRYRDAGPPARPVTPASTPTR